MYLPISVAPDGPRSARIRHLVVLLACVLSAVSLRSTRAQTAPAGPWTVPVLVLRYFPVTAGGDEIDRAVTGNVGGSLEKMREKCERMTHEAATALEQGSRFRAYTNAAAPASLRYEIVDTIDYLEAIPHSPSKRGRADYLSVLQRAKVADYVERRGVKEVWIWGYHSKELAPWESNMASPHGDISNSDRDPRDLPILQKSYVVYHYNYERGTSEAVHNHIHQIEAVMRHHGGELWKTWEGTKGRWRCGNCHFPPNAKSDYDWANKEYVESDIEDWRPEGFGTMKRINCETWDCDSLQWFIYWMRSMPGARNGLRLGQKPLTNWWIFMGDYDAAITGKVGLVER